MERFILPPPSMWRRTGRKTELTLVSPAEDNCARLAVTVKGKAARRWILYLFFLRIPIKEEETGCVRILRSCWKPCIPDFCGSPAAVLVHDGSLDADDRNSMYRWKNTIGPLWERPARRSNWGYNQTLGLGYYEYFQLWGGISAPNPFLSFPEAMIRITAAWRRLMSCSHGLMMPWI